MDEYMQAERDKASAKEMEMQEAAKDAKREAAEEELGLKEKKKTSKLNVKQSELAGEIGDVKKKFKLQNPITLVKRTMARRKIRQENHYLKREETMKQDTERYLMEMEEKHTWLAYELRSRNAVRMRKEHDLSIIKKKESRKDRKKQQEIEMQQGLSYFRGEIINYKCWQNSEAKHLDITGHEGSVSSVKLSKCLKYIISSSFDKTAKLWSLANGKCLYTFSGHTKKVNDCDLHMNFTIDSVEVGVVTCSSDATIRYWNCKVSTPLKVVTGHAEAVYRCSFAPDGQRVVSCSEDMTSRVWSVPEGFMLFAFKAHTSPVTAVNFSPSGKYLISASDYGERRLMLWNAGSPLFKESVQLPHMVFWTEQGLIKKLLFCKQTPDQHFWLTFNQLGQLPDDELVTTWPGETDTGEDIVSESDSDAESDDEFEEEDDFGKDDIRDINEASLGVIFVNKEGEKIEATEYIAGGGTLVITLQSIHDPIAEAFVSVNLKDQQFDSYDTQSGDRVGSFKAADPIPWREFFTDPLNLKPPYRMPPKSVTESCQRKAFTYREQRKFDKQTGEEVFDSYAVEMLWTCPPPKTGAVVVTANFRFRSENFRRKMTYSLKESPIRMNAGGGEDTDEAVGEDGARYLFDQEERHTSFFRFLQDRNWQAVESFLDRKCMIYFERKRFIRRRKTIEMLQRLFGKMKKAESIVAGVDLDDLTSRENNSLEGWTEEEKVKALKERQEKKRREDHLDMLSKRPVIVASPLIHQPGHTRSSVMCEDFNVFADKRNMAAEERREQLEKQRKKEEKAAKKAQRKAERKALREERRRLQAKAEEEEAGKNNEGTTEVVTENSGRESDGSDSDDDSTDSDSDSDSSGSYETDSDDSGSGSSYETDSSGSYETGSSEDSEILPPILEVDEEHQEEKNDEMKLVSQISRPLLQTKNSVKSMSSDKPIEKSLSKSKLSRSNLIEASSSKTNMSDAPPLSPAKSVRSIKSLKSNVAGDDDDDDDLTVDSDDLSKRETLRDALQVLPSIVYTEPVEGESFYRKVKQLAKREVTKATTLKLLGFPNPNELREHTTKGHTAQSLLAWGNSPQWVSEQANAVAERKEAKLRELEAMGMGDQGVPEEESDIKDGMFGPRFDGLNMKLPRIFPSKAGKAKDALKQSIKKNEKSERKEKLRRIPTPTEAVVLYEEKKKKKLFKFKKPKYWQQREERRKEAELLEDDIKLHILVNSGYPTARRQSLSTLPGMSDHYPNPGYANGAVIPNGYHPEKNGTISKKGILSALFGTSKQEEVRTVPGPLLLTNGDSDSVNTAETKTPAEKALEEEALIKKGIKIVRKFPSVGNKPLSFSTIQKKKKAKKTKKKTLNEEDGDGSEDNNEEDEHEGSTIRSELSKKSHHYNSRGSSRRSSRNSRPNSRTATRESRRSSNKSHVSVSSQFSQSNTLGSLDSLQHHHTGTALGPLLESKEEEESFHQDLLQSLNYLENDTFSQHMLNVDVDANEYHYNDAGNRSEEIPKGVYLGRRGSFMIAPGLESFQALTSINNDEEEEEKTEVDSITSLMKRKKAKNANKLAEFATVNKKIEAPGLLCVMHTRGFNVAHQGGINDAVFAPSENRVASCSGDHLIKIWDTRDGSHVRTLKDGHEGEVTSVSYTRDEMYLVSSGCDRSIVVWDMALFSVTRILRGHVDVINTLAISHDATFMVSGSYDSVIKTWFLTPRVPEAPLPPKIITKTHNTVMIKWTAPPSFNEPITAFFLQYRIPGQDYWSPKEPYTIPPTYRQKTLKGLPPCTTYQYRLKAANRMGESEWGAMSKLVTTLMGVPLQLERPEVCDVTASTMSIFFFTPNPKLYGAAPHTYKLQWSGSGVDFDSTGQSLSLEEGRAEGERMTSQFTFWISPEGDAIRKKKKREANQSRSAAKGAIPVFEISQECLSATVARTNEIEDLLVSCTIKGLEYGKLYRIRVAGINDAGEGPWSKASYSTATLPGLPHVPAAPYRIARGLTWVRLQWDPPQDSGSAIVGYRIYIKHRDYYLDLPRWQVTYEMTKLLPGHSYAIKVLAKNVVGWTEYGPYNDEVTGETATAPPDTPPNPTPYAGGWGYLKLKTQIPFDNGRPVTHMYCQMRTVQAFNKGQWSKDLEYDINNPSQVTFQKEAPVAKKDLFDREESDSDSDEDWENLTVKEIAKLKKKKLLKKSRSVPQRKVLKRMATGVLQLFKEEKGVESEFEKKMGRTIMFTVDHLVANTMYEFRVCFANETGRSEYSIPSQRAKTNRADVPDVCKTPKCVDISKNFLIVGFQAPIDGGSELIKFSLKLECLDRDPETGETVTQVIRILPHFTQHKIEKLKPGGSYRVCISAINEIGEGEFSPWTKAYKLPRENS